MGEEMAAKATRGQAQEASRGDWKGEPGQSCPLPRGKANGVPSCVLPCLESYPHPTGRLWCSHQPGFIWIPGEDWGGRWKAADA